VPLTTVLPEVTIEPAGAGTWDASLPQRWNVGRNQNGGVLLAAASSALSAAAEQPHALSVTGHYLRAAGAGRATVRTTMARRGRTASTGVAEVEQDGTERMRMIGTFGDLAARDRSRTPVAAVAPPIPGPDDCADLFDLLAASPQGQRTLTRSLRNFAIRVDPGRGWGPDGDGHPALSGWIRLGGEETVGAQMLPGIADGFPPTLLSQAELGWLPTLELTVHVFAVPVADEPWLRAELRTRTVTGGLVDEDGELWDASGQLVARFRQLCLLLDPPT
jgi:acyl-coenzyme A thioesterase PaaI-like protein